MLAHLFRQDFPPLSGTVGTDVSAGHLSGLGLAPRRSKGIETERRITRTAVKDKQSGALVKIARTDFNQ